MSAPRKDGLRDLTLVIPSYERGKQLARSLEYWSDQPMHVIVVDGSREPLACNYRYDLGANVKYIHAPISFEQRLCLAADMITTEFTALIGDDEFYLLEGLRACMEELRRDARLVQCGGRTLGTYGTYTLWGRRRISAIRMYEDLAGYETTSRICCERILERMSAYYASLIYSVARSAPWKKAMRCIATAEIPAKAAAEAVYEVVMAHEGRTIVVDHLLWLRNQSNQQVYSYPTMKFREWWRETSQSRSFSGAESPADELVRVIAENVMPTCQLSPHASETRAKLIRQGLDVYARPNQGADQPSTDRFTEHLPRELRRQLWRHAPGWAAALWRSVRLDRMEAKPILAAAADLDSDGVRVDWANLSRAVDLMLRK